MLLVTTADYYQKLFIKICAGSQTEEPLSCLGFSSCIVCEEGEREVTRQEFPSSSDLPLAAETTQNWSSMTVGIEKKGTQIQERRVADDIPEKFIFLAFISWPGIAVGSPAPFTLNGL